MKAAMVAFSLMPVVVLAEESNISQSHSHGTGTLIVTHSDTSIQLSFSAPGADIVGFEHPAENNDDRVLVARAVSDLSKPLELFEPPVEAGCFNASANVTLTSVAQGQSDKAGDERHMEFVADYRITCQNAEQLDRVKFAYFDRFPNAGMLRLQVVCGDVAQVKEVSRTDPIAGLTCTQ